MNVSDRLTIQDHRPMNIRVAHQGDIDTLFDIRTSVVENYQSREEIAELGITPESVGIMLETDCCAWIAEMSDGDSVPVAQRPIGFAIANATEETILGLFVRPECEGRGVGRQLIQAAENWLQSKGLKQIWLLTGNDPKLRAYGFYLHLGWAPVGVEAAGDFKGEMKFVKQLTSIED